MQLLTHMLIICSPFQDETMEARLRFFLSALACFLLTPLRSEVSVDTHSLLSAK